MSLQQAKNYLKQFNREQDIISSLKFFSGLDAELENYLH